jgi:peptidoglycan/LPS O-acetylase OafA/YrhL
VVRASGRSPWPDGLLPAFATAGLLWALHHHPQAWVARLLASAPMRRIGLLSYSLYLWHWPVFVLMLDRGPADTVADDRCDGAGAAAVMAVVALGGTTVPRHVGAASASRALGADGAVVLLSPPASRPCSTCRRRGCR